MKIKQVIGKPYFKIDNDRYTDEALAAMPVDGLKALKTRLEMKIQNLAGQIKAKKIGCAEGGQAVTREWYAGRKYALNVNQRMLPFLADMIKRRNREERSLADYFVDEARIFLDKETYETIMRNAAREKNLLCGG